MAKSHKETKEKILKKKLKHKRKKKNTQKKKEKNVLKKKENSFKPVQLVRILPTVLCYYGEKNICTLKVRLVADLREFLS